MVAVVVFLTIANSAGLNRTLGKIASRISLSDLTTGYVHMDSIWTTWSQLLCTFHLTIVNICNLKTRPPQKHKLFHSLAFLRGDLRFEPSRSCVEGRKKSLIQYNSFYFINMHNCITSLTKTKLLVDAN